MPVPSSSPSRPTHGHVWELPSWLARTVVSLVLAGLVIAGGNSSLAKSAEDELRRNLCSSDAPRDSQYPSGHSPSPRMGNQPMHWGRRHLPVYQQSLSLVVGTHIGFGRAAQTALIESMTNQFLADGVSGRMRSLPLDPQCYGKDSEIILRRTEDLKLRIYADTSYGGEGGRPQTGALTTLGRQAIGWYSRQQEVVSRRSNTLQTAREPKTLPEPNNSWWN